MNELYYKLTNGKWVPEYTINEAFLISEGKERYGHESEFLDWLSARLNHSILEVKASTDPDLFNEALTKENKILAIKLYRDRHGCTLMEAKDAVEWLLGGENNNQT